MNHYKWHPPTVGEPTEDHVEVWTVAVGNLPIFKKKSVKEAINYIQSLDGFIGFYPCYPYGTLCLFKTENDAKGGKNLMEFKGIKTGDNIGTCYIDKEFVK